MHHYMYHYRHLNLILLSVDSPFDRALKLIPSPSNNFHFCDCEECRNDPELAKFARDYNTLMRDPRYVTSQHRLALEIEMFRPKPYKSALGYLLFKIKKQMGLDTR